MQQPTPAQPPSSTRRRELRIRAQDGLGLFAEDWGPLGSQALPVVCLPGLTRTTLDFEVLAGALSGERRVLAVDYRGRGRSDIDPDWTHYDIRVELADVLAMMDAAGIGRAVIIGTSRGGLIAMGMAAARPGAMAGLVLNDIGPVIEQRGLLRIRSYVGRLPQPRSLEEAVSILRDMNDTAFPDATAADWERYARGTWREENGRLVPQADPNLLKSMEGLDLERPLPPIWPYFDALPPIPLLSIRGGLSDILTAQTQEEMAARRPDLQIYVSPREGHAPLLTDKASIERIRAFVASCA